MFNVICKKIKKIGDAPGKFLLFAEGEQEVEGLGKFIVDEQGFERVRSALAKRGIEIVIDYEHQTLHDVKAPAAGWIRGADALEYVPGQGIVATVDWTEEAAGYIERGEYRYFSPVFAISKRDRRLVSLHSVALTNAPRTNNLKPILAKLAGSQEGNMDWIKKLLAKLGLAEGASEDDTLAAIDTLTAKAGLLNKIAAKLGLDDSADEAAVDTAIAKIKGDGGQPAVAADVVAALDLPADTADVSTVVASINALKHNGQAAVDSRVQALESKLAERDAKDAVAAAKAAGKITPEQEEWALAYAKKDLAGFTSFVAKAAQVVPIDSLPGKKKEADTAVADESVMAVAKQMGVTTEDLKTYGGLNADQ